MPLTGKTEIAPIGSGSVSARKKIMLKTDKSFSIEFETYPVWVEPQ
jgi:hypothetical protein